VRACVALRNPNDILRRDYVTAMPGIKALGSYDRYAPNRLNNRQIRTIAVRGRHFPKCRSALLLRSAAASELVCWI
jgi:hypothetical protein